MRNDSFRAARALTTLFMLCPALGGSACIAPPGRLKGPYLLAIDSQEAKLYWAVGWPPRIRRANLNGARIETIVQSDESIAGLAIDNKNGKLYWTTNERGAFGVIHRAELDGSAPEVIITEGLGYARGITIDAASGRLYWVQCNPEGVLSANLDGSDIRAIVGDPLHPSRDSFARRSEETGLVCPVSIAMNGADGKLYWTDNTEKIQRCNVDGSDVENLIKAWGGYGQIALDSTKAKMYWREIGTIRRANLDGTEIEDFVSGARTGGGFAIDVSTRRLYWTDPLHWTILSSNLDGTGKRVIIRTRLWLWW